MALLIKLFVHFMLASQQPGLDGSLLMSWARFINQWDSSARANIVPCYVLPDIVDLSRNHQPSSANTTLLTAAPQFICIARSYQIMIMDLLDVAQNLCLEAETKVYVVVGFIIWLIRAPWAKRKGWFTTVDQKWCQWFNTVI